MKSSMCEKNCQVGHISYKLLFLIYYYSVVSGFSFGNSSVCFMYSLLAWVCTIKICKLGLHCKILYSASHGHCLRDVHYVSGPCVITKSLSSTSFLISCPSVSETIDSLDNLWSNIGNWYQNLVIRSIASSRRYKIIIQCKVNVCLS